MTVAFAEACSGPAAATESPLKGKGEPVSAQTSKDDRGIERDGHYVRYENGVVYDEKTGLEWVAGPDWGTNWDEAKKWVSSLNVPGGGWRMPKRDELRTLYQKGAGERNMTPLLQTTGWSVWSGEIKDSSSAWYFNLRNGLENWICRDISLCDRGFAVRSRR